MSTPRLDAAQSDLLRLVYREFERVAEWPTATGLQKLVWRSGMDVEAVADNLPENLVSRDYSRGGAIKLTLAGLIACGGAEHDLKLFADAMRLLVSRLDDSEPRISTSDLVQQLLMSEADVRRLRTIFAGEYSLLLPVENDKDGNPYVWRASDDAWRFANAKTAQDYVRIKYEIAQRRRTALPRSQPLPGSPFVDLGLEDPTEETATARKVFVAYPWSAYNNREDYKSAFTGLQEELAVEFVFAESRLSERHVLEKIEGMIKEAAFGIYDLTRWNPNVSLEYGYARGLGRQAFIAFNPTVGESTDVPADIRGYDRIQYESFAELAREVRNLVIQQLGPADSTV